MPSLPKYDRSPKQPRSKFGSSMNQYASVKTGLELAKSPYMVKERDHLGKLLGTVNVTGSLDFNQKSNANIIQ